MSEGYVERVISQQILLLFVEMEISDRVLWSSAQLKKHSSAVILIDAIFFSLETQYYLRGRETIQVHR